MMLERDVERHLVKRVKAVGGEVRKVKWLGRVGAPDRVVMLPGKSYEANGIDFRPGTLIWVELKAPGKRPRKNQILEHARMRLMGQRVEVIDTIEKVEELLS